MRWLIFDMSPAALAAGADVAPLLAGAEVEDEDDDEEVLLSSEPLQASGKPARTIRATSAKNR
jgi:hypothetical protein